MDQLTEDSALLRPPSSIGGPHPEKPLPNSVATDEPAADRPVVCGKYIFVGGEKFWVRGATYGTFRPGPGDHQFPAPDIVDRDFAMMAGRGLNAVRVYTPPPRWLLDAAQAHGLRVMVGLPWEQHVAFLDDSRTANQIIARVCTGVRACAGHPAVLCYAIGNEISAQIVRLYGRNRIRAFLKQVFNAAKAEDPQGLFTYVNFPSTEYLDLPFLDIFAFNVYLETEDRLSAYLARLQNLAGNRPLLMAEIGLDSRRNGEAKQADVLDWQIRRSFEAGSCGAFIFAWTDEWYRGGHDIEDWDFGLTTRDRKPKPALDAVANAFAKVPFEPDYPWPMISVVVCTYNGSSTIRDTLEGLRDLDYPRFEVIVVDDGSTDATAEIVREYDVRLISTENSGLSSARNTGLDAANGEILAYIDDDAYPDPDWLKFLAAGFLSSDHAGIGGPNIAPAGDGPIAECVANAPGGPVHVLLSDRVAEHIPGCNMAFRKERLKSIGGFDPRFRAAGDDVDVCWRLQDRGWTLGFSAGAMNWHHRRNSVRAYYRQQLGYGKAESLLERKWPEKYNNVGHLNWAGRLYGNGLIEPLGRRQRIYHGMWGSAPFQSLYERASDGAFAFLITPEWYLLIAMLAGLVTLSAVWTPLLVFLPLLILAVVASLAQAAAGGIRASFQTPARSRLDDFKRRLLTATLHLIQPFARLVGRLNHGLSPWRCHNHGAFIVPWPRRIRLWDENWQSAEERLFAFESALKKLGAVVLRGGNFDSWDLEIRGGGFGSVRTRLAIEEHGAGAQLVHLRSWPRISGLPAILIVGLTVMASAAALDRAWLAMVIFGLAAGWLVWRSVSHCAGVTRLWSQHAPALGGQYFASTASRQEKKTIRPTELFAGLRARIVPRLNGSSADETGEGSARRNRRLGHIRNLRGILVKKKPDRSDRTAQEERAGRYA